MANEFDNWEVAGDPGEFCDEIRKTSVCFKLRSGRDVSKWS